MRTPMKTGRWLLLPLALAGILAAGSAGAVTITCGSGSGLAGQTVEIAINTSDLTALGVQSWQFVLNYAASQVTATGVVTAGTLTGTAGWPTPTFNVTSGQISVSAAGATALTGIGTLIKLQFLVNPALLNGGGTGLSFQSFLMNEGTPAVTTSGGSLSIGVTPQIYVSPNTGEIVRGQTLAFSVSGSVTPPVAWSTTNPLVATINSAGLLTGVAPGSVRVTALDNAGRSDVSDGDILIRGMSMTIGNATIIQGQSTSIPVSVTSLSGLGVRSGQFTVAYNPSYLSFTSMTAPPGTLLNGYGSSNVGNASGVVSVDFAGTTDLTGSGVLCYLNFSSIQSAYIALTLQTALFNETLPALRTSGYINVNPIPGITVSPYSVTLLAGQTQQYTVGGTPTLPITWSTLDPSVATINAAGLLTAVAGGVTQVRAVDAVSATATSGPVTVYDCKLTIPNYAAPQGATMRVPLILDRAINGLNVFSAQYMLSYSSPWITAAFAEGGLMAAWGAPNSHYTAGNVRIASAGAHKLGTGQFELEFVDLTVSPAAPPGTYIPLTLTSFMFNEGKPIAQIVNGSLSVISNVDVPPAQGAEFALGAAEPNPAHRSARIGFTIPASDAGGERVTLAVYGLDGRRVRTLLDGAVGAGPQSVSWDATDDQGRGVSAGLYFYRLEWRGRHLERKIALVR